jgi:hypothetical protein
MDELKHIHFDMVNDYIKNSKENSIGHYMLTVSRDGESPVRSIVSFDNLEQALEGYEMYQDAGFAKDYLTVSMYEPSGKINTKVLKRNHAGDPSFVRQNYIDTVDALHKVKDKLNKEDYEDLCIKIVTSFAKDNWRFNIERFLKQLEIERTL